MTSPRKRKPTRDERKGKTSVAGLGAVASPAQAGIHLVSKEGSAPQPSQHIGNVAYPAFISRKVLISKDEGIEGELCLPEAPRGVVLLIEGFENIDVNSPLFDVAYILQDSDLATVLPNYPVEDVLSFHSMAMRGSRVSQLADRIVLTTRWILAQAELEDLKIGYFCRGEGVPAALQAAAEFTHEVSAIVAEGGRLDLAGDALCRVDAPVLSIVGGDDSGEIAVNREALKQLPCEKKLSVLPATTYVLDSPGSFLEIAKLAKQWFGWNLGIRQDQIQIE